MLNSKILVGISLAVWNSFAAYQVARSTAGGAMGEPKTYGYGLALTTGLTALWIWSGIIKESGGISNMLPTETTSNSKLSPTLIAMENAKWKSIIGMDFYTKGVQEMIQKEKAIAEKKGKKVSVAKIKKQAAAIEAARVKKIKEEVAIAEKNKKSKSAEDQSKNKKDVDPDYVPPSPAFQTGSDLRFPRKITITYGMNQERSVDITVPADLKYDGIAEEGVIGSSTGEGKKVILGLAFLRETTQGTYYPFVLRVNGVGRDFKTAADALEYNLKFILNAQPWNDAGDIPLDLDQDGNFDLIQDPAGNIKKPWWTDGHTGYPDSTKRAENNYEDFLPEVPWNLEYVSNAKLSHDSWAVNDMATLEKEIRQNKHTNQFMQVGCPVCGSVNEFFRNVSNNGIRYNCMDCMYASGDHYVSLKSRGDKTLADFGMATLCGVCGDTIHAYTNSQFQRHMDKHKSEKVSESETLAKQYEVSSGKIMNSENSKDDYEKTYGRAGARIRRKIKKDLMEENSFGTKSGQWSARKSQELKKRYEAAMKAKGLKPYKSKRSKSQKDLSQWTKQDWTTASGNKSSTSGEPYFPAKAVAALKKAKLYKKARAQKRRATAAGKQYARYSPDIQAIVANYRGENTNEK